MKNALKPFLLAAAVTMAISACSGNKKGGSADSSKVDSSVSTSVKTDTTVKMGTAGKDTAKLVADTPKMKVDTMSTTTKKTVVKKVTLKKQ